MEVAIVKLRTVFWWQKKKGRGEVRNVKKWQERSGEAKEGVCETAASAMAHRRQAQLTRRPT